MIGWIFIVTAVTLIAATFCTTTIWLLIDNRSMSRFATQVQAQRDKLNTKNAELFAQNADLREILQETIAERESLRLQLNEALKPKVKARLVKKVDVKP